MERPNHNGCRTTKTSVRQAARTSNNFAPAARSAAHEVRQARAAEGPARLAPLVKELRAAGVTSLNGMAAAFNERGVLTPRGHGQWYAMQISRVQPRIGHRSNQNSSELFHISKHRCAQS
jgi:hypothetical protein